MRGLAPMRWLAALALVIGLCAAPVLAQDGPDPELPPSEREVQGPLPGPSYQEWERVARRAEVALEEDRASNAALEGLRTDLVEWREKFQTGQKANEARIATLRAQIAALGAPPADGTPEPAEVAARRAELTAQLARIEAPRRTADEAFSRADNLIGEIDARIRERQANELLQLGPSPVNPANWLAPVRTLAGFAMSIAGETREAMANPVAMKQARENLPVVAVLGLIALVLLGRSHDWMERLCLRLEQRWSPHAAAAARFVLSLGQALLQVIGVILLAMALIETNLFGFRGETVINALPGLGFILVGALWLARQIFPRGEAGNVVLALPPERRAEGRFFAGLLALMLWGIVVAREIGALEGWNATTTSVLHFPFLVIGGLCLVRIGQLIGNRRGEMADVPQASQFRRRLGQIVGRAAVILGLTGPVLAAIGYLSAANFLTVPAATSLALLAFLVLLQRFATQVYAVATRRTEAEISEALVPVLIGLALSVAALPVFALIWGARVADLTEIWSRMRTGFAVGDTRISPGQFLTFIFIFAVGYMATRLLQGTLRATVLPKTRLDLGGQNAIVSGIGYVGILLAALFAITSTGIDLSSLAIVFGALSVGIGFGLQNIVQNFVSGIIMLVERPVAEGDWIEVGGKVGIVKDISVRSTRIETFDRTDVIVPNGEFISGIVTNWTRGNLTGRITISVGVAYGSDTRRVEAILREIAEAHPLVSLKPPPSVVFARFGADALEFEVRAILRDVNFGGAVKSDMHHEIAARFKAEGIEIPFGQRDIWLRNPEALRGLAPEPPKGEAP